MADQALSASSIPVWDVGGPPTQNAGGVFSADRGDANAAIPVYLVVSVPARASEYPADQGYIAQHPPQGALPVRVVAKPTPNSDGSYPCDPANDNAAIPVWFVPNEPADSPPYATGAIVESGVQRDRREFEKAVAV